MSRCRTHPTEWLPCSEASTARDEWGPPLWPAQELVVQATQGTGSPSARLCLRHVESLAGRRKRDRAENKSLHVGSGMAEGRVSVAAPTPGRPRRLSGPSFLGRRRHPLTASGARKRVGTWSPLCDARNIIAALESHRDIATQLTTSLRSCLPAGKIDRPDHHRTASRQPASAPPSSSSSPDAVARSPRRDCPPGPPRDQNSEVVRAPMPLSLTEPGRRDGHRGFPGFPPDTLRNPSAAPFTRSRLPAKPATKGTGRLLA